MGLLAKNMQILADTDMLSNMPCAFANWFFTPFYMIYHFKFGVLSHCTKPGDQWFFFRLKPRGLLLLYAKKESQSVALQATFEVTCMHE